MLRGLGSVGLVGSKGRRAVSTRQVAAQAQRCYAGPVDRSAVPRASARPPPPPGAGSRRHRRLRGSTPPSSSASLLDRSISASSALLAARALPSVFSPGGTGTPQLPRRGSGNGPQAVRPPPDEDCIEGVCVCACVLRLRWVSSWYWPPGRTYKSPEKALGFSHVSLARCRSICSQSPLIELETESLEAVSVTEG